MTKTNESLVREATDRLKEGGSLEELHAELVRRGFEIERKSRHEIVEALAKPPTIRRPGPPVKRRRLLA